MIQIAFCVYWVYVVYMDASNSSKKRRNIYMGQEYLDLEAIAVNERKRTGHDVSVADLIRRACKDFTALYWKKSVGGDK